jgi:hypothetical protein
VSKEKFGVGHFLRQKSIAENENTAILDSEKAQVQGISVTNDSAEPRRRGPKGRGAYRKRTIDLPLDLDEFIEHARRQHVRPDGRSTTAYSHFVEDLIAAERNRRAAKKPD